VTDPQPTDTWARDVEAGKAILLDRAGAGSTHRLRIAVHTPVSRGARADETVVYERELDIDTTAVLVARAGYDALNRDLAPGGAADPTAALLALAAAHRDPAVVAAAVYADRFTGSGVTLRIVAAEPLVNQEIAAG
jgi:hypothetical protein